MGTVIKAGAALKLKTRFKHLALRDHMAEARATLQSALDRAAEITEEANREAVQFRAEARATGFREGHGEGREAGLREGHDEAYRMAKEEFAAQQSHLASLLTQLANSFEAGKQELLERAERDLLGFAVALAGRMAKSAGQTDREVALHKVRAAIDGVGEWTDLLVRVNPMDHEAVGEYADHVRRSLDDRRHIRITDDATIEPGGCVVESNTVRVDATLETQYAEMVELLLG
ncbi:MAG: hypothetical protein HOP29_00580 [Phycisphaerales bacterium]|nr:hypothetical protein [Phycisphaerales bacterium]